jgi:hypothetical protein
MENRLMYPRRCRAQATRLREMAMTETDRYVRAELIAAARECDRMAIEFIGSRGFSRGRGTWEAAQKP